VPIGIPFQFEGTEPSCDRLRGFPGRELCGNRGSGRICRRKYGGPRLALQPSRRTIGQGTVGLAVAPPRFVDRPGIAARCDRPLIGAAFAGSERPEVRKIARRSSILRGLKPISRRCSSVQSHGPRMQYREPPSVRVGRKSSGAQLKVGPALQLLAEVVREAKPFQRRLLKLPEHCSCRSVTGPAGCRPVAQPSTQRIRISGLRRIKSAVNRRCGGQC
jgi:hypothetical protein